MTRFKASAIYYIGLDPAVYSREEMAIRCTQLNQVIISAQN